MAIEINNIFSDRINTVLKTPTNTFLIISFLSTFLGVFLDTIKYFNSSLSLLLTLNVLTLVLLFISFVLFRIKKINTQITAAILIYLIIINITFSNIILVSHNMPNWEYNLLRDTFITAVFITISGFILNAKHIVAINLIFSSSVIYIAIISAPSYISDNALFLVLMLVGFSYGVIFFRSNLISSLKQNDELNRKILLKEEALNTEKELRLEETINYKNRELVSNALVFAQNMEVKNKMAKKIRSVEKDVSSKLIPELLDLLSQMSTSDNSKHWNEFHARFNDVHQDFYHNISKQFPNLSPAEQKLAAFIKLKMSSKEIALLTQNSKDSIDVARSRLRKKMNLLKSDNFVVFLSKI